MGMTTAPDNDLELGIDKNQLAEPAKVTGQKDDEEKKDQPRTSYWTLLFRFSTWREKLLILFGSIGAAAAGAALPLFAFLIADAFEELFLGKDVVDTMLDVGLLMLWLGLGAFVAGWLAIACFAAQAELQAERIRSIYLSALLRCEVAFFDEHKPGELGQRITVDVAGCVFSDFKNFSFFSRHPNGHGRKSRLIHPQSRHYACWFCSCRRSWLAACLDYVCDYSSHGCCLSICFHRSRSRRV
jgi:hypothetical protein